MERAGLRKHALASLAVVAVLAGCASAQAVIPESRGTARAVPAADPRPFAAGDTAFGLDVLRSWCQTAPRQNLVFSPATLASALGEAYLGSRGATAQAMARVLHLPSPATTTPASSAALLAGLRARLAALDRLNGPGVTLAADDRIWEDPSLPAARSYLDALATGYRAGVSRVPLLTDAQRAAAQINSAIGDATRGHITHLLTPDMLRGIGWVLTSALYLHADWATPFQASATTPMPFQAADGGPVSVPFMKANGVQTAIADGWTSVALPYRGGKLSLVALLPPAAGPSCAMPSAAALRVLTRAGSTGSVALPKVSLHTTGQMDDLLKSLGMGIAFGGQADFTGISPQAASIGFVQQAATLQVDEKGSTGAAAAAVGITASAGVAPDGRPVVFNRPYLLLITSASGEPLFLARVANPHAS